MNKLYFILLTAFSIFFGSPNPFYHIPLLILVYPASLFLIAKKSPSAKDAFLTALFGSTLGSSLAVYWFIIPVHEYGHFPLILALPIPLCMGFYLGLYGALYSYCIHKIKHCSDRKIILFTFFLWFFLEWLRSWFLTGFTWLNISAALSAFPFLVQGASIIGMTALSAYYAMLGAALVSKSRIKWAACILIILPIFLVSIFPNAYFSFTRILSTLSFEHEEEEQWQNILLVQGNLDQSIKWDKNNQEHTINKYLQLSLKGIIEAKNQENLDIDLIVFPETSMPFFLQDKKNYMQRFLDFSKEHNVALMVGGISYDFNHVKHKKEYFNSVFLIKPDDSLTSYFDIDFYEPPSYSKQHLVPFGEYVPEILTSIPILSTLLQDFGGFTAKKEQDLLYHTEDIPSGLLLCYEAIFSEIAQEQVEQGAKLLINISNDAWYGRSSAAKQHLDISRLRAIEQRKPLIRATNTGITAFINPYGEVIKSTELFVDASIFLRVKLNSTLSIYHKIKPYLAYALNLLFCVFFIILYRTKQEKTA